MWDNFRVISVVPNYVIPLWPDPEYPHGRKAQAMSDLWAWLRAYDTPGICWFDPDVAADPDDLAAMQAAVNADPTVIYTGMIKLWPQSTGRSEWIWSHRGGTIGAPTASQDENQPVTYFATGFLWTPAELLDLAFPAHARWQWLELDVQLPQLAALNHIAARTVPGCRPKHLHFSKEHEPWTDQPKPTAPGDLPGT